MLKKVLKILSFTLLIFIIGIALYFFRPWADHQGWRMFHKANPFLERIYTQSNWDLVSQYAVLKASENPRQYKRALTDLEDITYEYDGERYTAKDYYKKANLVVDG